MTLTPVQLAAIVPGIKQAAIDTYGPWLTTYLPDPRYKIDSAARIGGFIAQVAEESASLSTVLEFASGKLYEGREDLGNIHPGDGPLFKGRGLIQITGRKNYTSCSIALFEDPDILLNNPQILTLPQYAVQSACWYWSAWGLNDICDEPENFIHPGEHHYNKFQWLTVKINGGLNGYNERLANYERAKQVLNF